MNMTSLSQRDGGPAFRIPNSEFRFSARYYLPVLLAVSVLIVFSASTAFADALVVTKAMTASTVVEISIEQSEIVVEMGVPDLLAFHNLLPDEMRTQMGLEPAPLSERLALFFREDFVIRANGDPPLPGRVVDIEPRRRVPRDELTGEPFRVSLPEGARMAIGYR